MKMKIPIEKQLKEQYEMKMKIPIEKQLKEQYNKHSIVEIFSQTVSSTMPRGTS